MLILAGVIFILPMAGNQLGIDLNVFQWLVWTPVSWLLGIFTGMAGIS